ncbi:MAG: radical SAM protein, partial [Candidatus Omnitrophota bacterium]
MIIKKENSSGFYRDMSFAARNSKFPLKAMFELTYRCNFRCVHCYVAADKKKKELGIEEVKVILDQLKKAGCFHVGFTGGELFLRKDIFKILNYAKQSGFRISILTNGFLID